MVLYVFHFLIIAPTVDFFTPSCLPIADSVFPAWCRSTIVFLVSFDSSLVLAIVWERLIRLVKKVLYSTLQQQCLDDENFHTILCEAEAILNDCPITKLSDDPNDLEALTPNHIWQLRSKPFLPPGLFQKSDLYIRRRWRQVQYLSDLFWKKWIKEYLPLLQE